MLKKLTALACAMLMNAAAMAADSKTLYFAPRTGTGQPVKEKGTVASIQIDNVAGGLRIVVYATSTAGVSAWCAFTNFANITEMKAMVDMLRDPSLDRIFCYPGDTNLNYGSSSLFQIQGK